MNNNNKQVASAISVVFGLVTLFVAVNLGQWIDNIWGIVLGYATGFLAMLFLLAGTKLEESGHDDTPSS